MGLEQAVDTIVPSVQFYRGFRPFVEQTIPEIRGRYDRMMLAHPDSPSSLQNQPDRYSGRTLLAIGPEGGWIDFEVDKMIGSGFSSFGIGPRILRVDTAVIALHSMISLHYASTGEGI